MNFNENKLKAKEIAQKSIIESLIKKQTNFRDKEIKEHKKQSLFRTILIGLTIWLTIGTFTKNIILSFSIAIILSIPILLLFIYAPIIKAKDYAKKVESDLPEFLTKVIYELNSKKSFLTAINEASKENGYSNKEFQKVIQEIEKGASFAESLEKLNKRTLSTSIKRTNSNLYNIWLHSNNNTSSLNKLTKELYLKQQLESKEFSSKMVVFSLVFIAISAIVPAMFQSFILIGSYFMKISLTSIEVFAIITILFPFIDLLILTTINKKTPLFLKTI